MSKSIHVIITDYRSHAQPIRGIRELVFVQEQRISRADELDDRDDLCLHSLALSGDLPLGTGRLDVEKEGKVGRLAVLKEFRRQGIGTLLMRAFEDYAFERQLPRLWLHAQLSAVPFYLALDYEVVSEEFEEAGIPHVVMHKRFR